MQKLIYFLPGIEPQSFHLHEVHIYIYLVDHAII